MVTLRGIESGGYGAPEFQRPQFAAPGKGTCENGVQPRQSGTDKKPFRVCPTKSVTNRELQQDGLIPFRAGALEVRQQTAALRHECQQTTTRRVILLMSLEMFGQL